MGTSFAFFNLFLLTIQYHLIERIYSIWFPKERISINLRVFLGQFFLSKFIWVHLLTLYKSVDNWNLLMASLDFLLKKHKMMTRKKMHLGYKQSQKEKFTWSSVRTPSPKKESLKRVVLSKMAHKSARPLQLVANI